VNRKIIVCAMSLSLALAGSTAAYAGGKKKAEYRSSWTYNKKSKTWKAKAVKKETTSQRIERLRKKTWGK
jgi:hypothetical protein